MKDEEKEQSLAYLQGKVEALQSILEAVIEHMPEVTLYGVLNVARSNAKDTIEKRDADAAHRDYDMAMRSYNLPDGPPNITQRTEGALDIYQPTIDWMEMRIWEHGEGASSGNIAPSQQGIDNLASVKSWKAEQGEPYP